MFYVYLISAIIFLSLGHYLRMKRWSKFIDSYEKPKKQVLLQSESLGYIVNYFIPFRIGDLFRAFFSGKRMKNGVSFSLATIIIERFLDIICVGLMFIVFYTIGIKTPVIKNSIYIYSIVALVLTILAIIFSKYNKLLKKITKKIAGIFNSKIELKILKLAWFTIALFKDMFSKLKPLKLAFLSILMWFMYLSSYALFALAIKAYGLNTSIVDIFTFLFSRNNLDIFNITKDSLLQNMWLVLSIYLVSPLIILFLSSFIFKKEEVEEKSYLELLPHINEQDRLDFLENYFEAEKREYFKNYLKVNSDICILQDYSAGSNATTMLCMHNDSMIYRKYSFGKDAEKLYEQIKWLEKHSKNLQLTKIMNKKKGDGYCSYDMPYTADAVGCFNYVHSKPIDKGFRIIKNVLEDLRKNLYTLNTRPCDMDLLNKYIDTKVYKNLDTIFEFKDIKALLKYDYIYINGKKYKNLNQFKKYFAKDYLINTFKNDKYSDIHGDLTIENIICLESKDDYYIIDPNTGNLHDSPFLDYAKLLQSIHGGYEFLMRTKSVNVSKDKINFIDTKSHIYDELLEKFKEYLYKHYSKEEVKSIFFHEIIHWLRLMPYKINKDTNRAVLFYAGLVKVTNDVIKEFGD